MSTSGSTDFIVTRDNIIEDALWLIGALGESETPSTATITKCSRVLNSMIKSWQADGLNMWTIIEGVVFLQADKIKYSLNATTGDAAAKVVAAETKLNGAVTSGSTALTVDSTTGMTVGDKITVQQDSGTLKTTTIATIPTSTTLTLTAALTGDAADNSRVTAYLATMDRPLQVLGVRYKDSNDVERPLEGLTKDQYNNIPNKGVASVPTSYYYDPQLTTGALYVWPEPSDSSGILSVTYTRVIEDFDSASNNPDFPVEWSQALTYNLAMMIAPAYGKGAEVVQTIGPMAQSFKQDILNWDNEKESMFLLPDNDEY